MSSEDKSAVRDGGPLALASVARAKRGTVEHEKAQKDAAAIRDMVLAGNERAARSALLANPSAYFPLRSMPHGTNANAKKMAAFLTAHTDRPHRQHGSRTNVPIRFSRPGGSG
jgi:hypothetical protein